LYVDDQLGFFQLLAQPLILALQLCIFGSQWIGLATPLLVGVKVRFMS
jgi:hypothetical protein